MPTTVKLDRATGIRVTTGSGVVGGQDLIDLYQQIISDPELANATRSLIDLREASLEGLSSADVRAAVNLPQLPRQAETRMAIVATTAVAYGMSRMYAMMQENSRPGEAQVFHEYADALAWLLAEPHGPR
jgi:hypothetical protein